ncbi:hypothetical protein CHS0354_036503 [Potamilus streckersoni]|uniref:Large ribosomal subunit protein uL24 C-terminal domain-containing protein n=1 Tax=Potamilus streckersoni TaxID=2493646 RepID=A0AAE0S3P0_9BIVA|nr:hypothetical protein CHS0354_036503 [Potamilus streckersoni]
MRLTVSLCCQYFKRYVQSEIEKKTGFRTWKPIRGSKVVASKKWYFTEHPPWTTEAQNANGYILKQPKVLVEPVKEWKIFIGDRVQVLVGKDKGKQGIVSYLVKERNWCFVEGLHCRFLNRTKTSTYPGVLLREEKPLLVTTEVALVDPSDGQPTEVEWRHTESGDRVRVSLRTGRIIPLTGPIPTDEDDHFIEAVEKYKDSTKDVPKKELEKVTFEPKLCTFEQDIMEKMEIKEDRKPAPTYWY